MHRSRPRSIWPALIACLVAGACCLGGPGPARAETGDELDRKIARLVEQLGDGEYAVRQRAQQELAQLGFAAFDALSDAEQSDDVEIATQAKYLIRRIRADWTSDNAPPQIRTILKDYDLQNDTARLARIKSLLDLPADAGLEWVCRLVRFEQSPVLSKQAALLILSQDPQPAEADWPRRAGIIAKTLDRSTRPAAQWLKNYVQMRSEPLAALPELVKLIAAERQSLEAHPQQSDIRIVTQLMRVEADELAALDRLTDALATMHELVAMERGDPQTLSDLVNWLVKRKAWGVIDEVATRFAGSFESDPALMYTLAQALQAEGQNERAEEIAQKALKLNPDRAPEHLQIAKFLQLRGLDTWSDREFRYLIGLGNVASDVALRARRTLAENLHDRQQDREAAEVLQGAVDALEKDPQLAASLAQRFGWESEAIKARTYFLFACHYGRENERAKQREFLDKAIAEDKTDADVLIGLYHLPDQTPEQRQATLELIRNAVQISRNKISEDDDSTQYNQLAWLVANTEGDFDEAVRLSQKSVEVYRAAINQLMSRDPNDARLPDFQESLGGHLDTLAHCYAAKKDYENAVKTQTEALKLVPHSHQISRKLEEFRRALAEQQQQRKPS